MRSLRSSSRSLASLVAALSLASLAACTAEATHDEAEVVPAEHSGETSQAASITTVGTTSQTGIILNPGILLPLGMSQDAATGVVTITGTSGNDVASVSSSPAGTLVMLNGKSTTFTGVTEIVFNGGDGDDDFSNFTSIKTTANGGDGDDILRGGSGPDFLVGGYGQDTLYGNGGNDVLWGSGGSDTMYGGDGDDVMFGHGGNDVMYGGNGRDTMNGGSGNDQLFGEAGQDLLVSIGGGVDTLTGGSQWDNFWYDTTDTVTDASPDEINLDYLHKVGSYYAVSYNGGSTTTAISLEAAGEDLPDPLPRVADTGLTKKSFDASPLFAPAGPTKDDIFQGSTGDCYFMAPLSAIANSDPEYIRKMVAPLGDGSYAVRFYDAGTPVYVRVDSDLWVDSNSALKYAKLGAGGSVWVPIVEKAYAFYRRAKGNYDSIASGDGTNDEDMDIATNSYKINDGITPEQVIAWNAAGQPAGTIKTAVTKGATDLLNHIKTQQAAGKPVMVGGRSTLSNNLALQVDDPSTSTNESTWRRGQHIYMVDHVNVDAMGNPTGMVLRNPYGSYLTLTDFTRIYFCVGGAGTWEI